MNKHVASISAGKWGLHREQGTGSRDRNEKSQRSQPHFWYVTARKQAVRRTGTRKKEEVERKRGGRHAEIPKGNFSGEGKNQEKNTEVAKKDRLSEATKA